MEIVANAKGSPIIWPNSTLPPRRASSMLCFFNEGEWRDPYEGMKRRFWQLECQHNENWRRAGELEEIEGEGFPVKEGIKSRRRLIESRTGRRRAVSVTDRVVRGFRRSRC